MENLTPWEVCLVVVGALLALATAINTLGAAAEKIAKARRAAKAPNEAQDVRLTALEEWRKSVDAKLANDKQHLETIDD